MNSGNQRRRLIKKHLEDSDTYRIPKKAVSHDQDRDFDKAVPSRRSNSSESSFDDFITDKVEYLSDNLPSSSEESAHSTDEENSRRKRRRESDSGESKESAHETSSEEIEDTPEPSEESKESEDEPKTVPNPANNLIGKAALEAKRAQGLLPPKSVEVSREKHKKHHHHKHKEKKKHKAKEHKKRTRSEKESKKYVQFGEFESPEDRAKADLVTKILVRWWYVLPDWPVACGYEETLTAKNLRQVDTANWLLEPLVDEKGREKVREVSGYPGVFQNSKGLLFDLRDKSECPSFGNLFSKPVSELRRLLRKALEAQLSELTAQPDYDAKLAKELSRELKHQAGEC